MMLGFDRPLYVLVFDHRGSFETSLFGWKGTQTLAQTTVIEAEKRIIYESFKGAVAAGVPKDKAVMLVDEQFSADILLDASDNGFAFACPVEKSDQEEFDFAYGESFPTQIQNVQPTFCKALVRYNPEGDQALNRRQADRLKQLSDYLHNQSRSHFMLELLVPAEKTQLEEAKGEEKIYDLKIRPRLIVHAIRELRDAHVEPDVWNVEGLDSREDCERIVAAVRHGSRDKVSCIVSGRGEDDPKMRERVRIAATVSGFIGFAVGRIGSPVEPTDLWQPLIAWREKRTTRDAAVSEIARRYREFVDIFEKNPGQFL
jgi:myo-inositol catabolism protein IolC